MDQSTILLTITMFFLLAINSSDLLSQSTDPFVPTDFSIPDKLETEKFRLRMLTFEQDLIDLGWHQKEFQRRTSFAYTVMNTEESQCLGCVYIDPTPKIGYDAEVYLWVRESEIENGLNSILYDAVKNWIEAEWPFKKVAYPGREIDWTAWKSLSE